MSHLGERLTALVDGELGHEERDRALAHLAICAECRAEAELLRRLKGRLRSLGDAVPPPADLIGRLYGMGTPPGPPPSEFAPPDPFMVAMSSFTSGNTPRRPAGNRPRGRATMTRSVTRRAAPRGRVLLAGATIAVLGVGGAAFAAGGDTGNLPRVAPSLEQFSVEHALTSGDVPVGDTTVTPSPTPTSPSPGPIRISEAARP
jgi:anti-sigma factor RsiW